VEGIFRVREPGAIFQKHVLVVDDVVTTGSTLEAAAEALLQAGAAEVSVATLACAEI
jgi:predicted amidophosphoribosyltransferase